MMSKKLVDYEHRLPISDPSFKPGYLECELGADFFYIDDQGRTFVKEARLMDHPNEGIQPRSTNKNSRNSGSGSGNWRDYKKRAVQKKRVGKNG